MAMTDYILVTPCKNEEKSLPEVIESVINQTIQPKLWVIVDDGSTDETPYILEHMKSIYSIIHTIRLPPRSRDITFHYSYVCKRGFDYILEYCKKNSIKYEYIGLLDADVIVETNYFEALICKFGENRKIGICSGNIGNIINEKVIWSDFRDDLPSGGARLWKKECFEETGGYIITCSPDSVSNIRAKIKGWETKQHKDIHAVSTRPYASAEGQWIGYKKLGSNSYFIGYMPLHVILKGMNLLYSRKGYFKSGVGLAYIYGYFASYFKKEPRIKDKEIIDYFDKRLGDILCSKLKSQRKTK